MSQFDLMVGEYKSMMDLQQFAKSQFEIIQTLSKKISTLEEEKKHLEELLEQTNPIHIGQSQEIVPVTDLGASDSEIIARTQLRMLRELSMKNELTLEESKKVQLFNDVLLSLNKNKDSDEGLKIEAIDPKELLAALESNNE